MATQAAVVGAANPLGEATEGKNDSLDNDTTTTTAAAKNPPAPMGWMRMKTMSSETRGVQYQQQMSKGAEEDLHHTVSSSSTDPNGILEVTSNDGLLDEDEDDRGVISGGVGAAGGQDVNGAVVYKVYKRRWFGLVQLALLNIVVSWDWLSYAALSNTASEYYQVSTTAINWLSTGFLFAFVLMSPFAIFTLHRGGPRPAIIAASLLLLLGNWIRYGGTRANNFGTVMFGQILIGLGQPFVLSAPTRYSDLWFTGQGRVAATAVMTLANPLGGAVAQLIDPFWAADAGDIPSMVLWIALLSSVASIPSFFIPGAPPTPCSASSAATKEPLLPSIKHLLSLPEFYLILIPFIVYVGLFNSLSSVINQVLYPYGFTETQAGVAGALLIVVGLVAAALTSPLIDRSKRYLPAIKLLVPIIAICYFVFIWAPPTRAEAAVYTIMAVLGAASFSLVPVVLEFLCELSHPVSPEVSSTICWTGGQLVGGIFILIAGVLTDGPDGGVGGDTPNNMQRNLWFQAALAVAVVPLPLSLGLFGRSRQVRLRRVEADKDARGRSVGVGEVVLVDGVGVGDGRNGETNA